MTLVLAADVGSTFTKLTAVDVDGRRIIGCAKAFTTIETQVMEGFETALAELRGQCGRLEFQKKTASSSAAGGLKMIAVGLVPDLTAQAARLAAANAGARILKTFAYELGSGEVAEIVALKPDMVLLSGGLDGGNRDVIIHNARALAASSLVCSVVAAGNKSAVDELRLAFKDFPGEVIFCANVMPEIDRLDIGPAQKAIRDLFIRKIISAKGLSDLQNILDHEIIPTPLAVLEAAELLSRGTRRRPGLGELVVLDVGGATTDVYSLAEGLPTRPNVFLRGFRQPFARRTVEGDLGVRYSQISLAEAAGLEDLAEQSVVDEEAVRDWLTVCARTPEILPAPDSPCRRIDQALAGAAVRISMARHCGSLEEVYTAMGRAYAQTGKDLSGVGRVVGTGGPIVNSPDPGAILREAVYRPSDVYLLKPLEPKLLVDAKYILSAMGLLSRFEAEAALEIMLTEMADVVAR